MTMKETNKQLTVDVGSEAQPVQPPYPASPPSPSMCAFWTEKDDDGQFHVVNHKNAGKGGKKHDEEKATGATPTEESTPQQFGNK